MPGVSPDQQTGGGRKTPSPPTMRRTAGLAKLVAVGGVIVVFSLGGVGLSFAEDRLSGTGGLALFGGAVALVAVLFAPLAAALAALSLSRRGFAARLRAAGGLLCPRCEYDLSAVEAVELSEEGAQGPSVAPGDPRHTARAYICPECGLTMDEDVPAEFWGGFLYTGI